MSHARAQFPTAPRYFAIWDDEDTRRWSADAELLAVTRKAHDDEGSAVRKRLDETLVVPVAVAVERAPAAPAVPTPSFASSESIRELFDSYVRVLGPAAKVVFANELRALGVAPSRVPTSTLPNLVILLSTRIPAGAVRERFVEESLSRFEKRADS